MCLVWSNNLQFHLSVTYRFPPGWTLLSWASFDGKMQKSKEPGPLNCVHGLWNEQRSYSPLCGGEKKKKKNPVRIKCLEGRKVLGSYYLPHAPKVQGGPGPPPQCPALSPPSYPRLGGPWGGPRPLRTQRWGSGTSLRPKKGATWGGGGSQTGCVFLLLLGVWRREGARKAVPEARLSGAGFFPPASFRGCLAAGSAGCSARELLFWAKRAGRKRRPVSGAEASGKRERRRSLPRDPLLSIRGSKEKLRGGCWGSPRSRGRRKARMSRKLEEKQGESLGGDRKWIHLSRRIGAVRAERDRTRVIT